MLFAKLHQVDNSLTDISISVPTVGIGESVVTLATTAPGMVLGLTIQ